MNRRHFCQTAFSATLPTIIGTSAHTSWAAEPFPVKPVRFIIPYAAGGGPDVQARILGPRLGEALGQAIVVENKVGAAGVMAAQYVAQVPADGYTLLMGSNTHLIQKIMLPDLKFEPIGDFAPISNMAVSPTVMVVRADAPYKTVQELIIAAKASPGKMNYGSGGIGTAAHLGGATLVSLAGLQVTHIPLKGSVEITASLMRGDIDFAFPVAATGVPQVKGGTLRALAVTSRTRLKELPDVPTLQEVLRSELAVQESWFGMWAPARTPPDVIAKIFLAVSKALRDPALRASFEASGSTATPSESPQAFASFIRNENTKWAAIVKLTGAKAE
jgi:tripartite-type tricarboxylate transporter receptor subunit TctC